MTGWTPAQYDTRTTTTTTALYDGTEGAAFNPGGSFQPAWLTLGRPLGLPKSIDGPRNAPVSDVTLFVYYRIDASVPAELRGRLAGAKNAAGHIVRYEAYDIFGNTTRTVEPNGVVSQSTYDALGRPTDATLKGVAGCDTAADPLCATDLTREHHRDPRRTGPGLRPQLRVRRSESPGHGEYGTQTLANRVILLRRHGETTEAESMGSTFIVGPVHDFRRHSWGTCSP